MRVVSHRRGSHGHVYLNRSCLQILSPLKTGFSSRPEIKQGAKIAPRCFDYRPMPLRSVTSIGSFGRVVRLTLPSVGAFIVTSKQKKTNYFH